jgi:3-hydroxybutyryl-CoA dehydrogenase
MEIKEVMVLGSGVMGTGIAQTAGQYGYSVILYGRSSAKLEVSLKNISDFVAKLIQRGKLNESRETILGRIRTTTKIDEGGKVDLVIESVAEDLQLKEELFRKLDEVCQPSAILSSNTSSIPISKLAKVTKRVDKVVGIHFPNPVPLMPVGEVIRTLTTSEETFEKAVAFVKSLQKEVVRVNMDIAGYVFNRVNLPARVEAIRLVERGVASIEDIDKAMRLGYGWPMGPFESSDLAGLDVGYDTLLSLYEETKDLKFYPPDLLYRKVLAGHLGKKVGKGWYEYGPNGEKKGEAK